MPWKTVPGPSHRALPLMLFPLVSPFVIWFLSPPNDPVWVSVAVHASQASMGRRDLLIAFKLLMSQQSCSASLCWKWILNSHLVCWFFLFSLCYYRYKGFKGNCSFSFIEQFRALHQCNEYCEMLGLKSLRTTHQKQRKATPTKSKNLPNSSTVKKMVPKKAREPRDFISSEHWVSLSHWWNYSWGHGAVIHTSDLRG